MRQEFVRLRRWRQSPARDSRGVWMRRGGGWGGKVWCSDPGPAGCSLTCQSQKSRSCLPAYPSGAHQEQELQEHTHTHTQAWKRHTFTFAHAGTVEVAPLSQEEREGRLCLWWACKLCHQDVAHLKSPCFQRCVAGSKSVKRVTKVATITSF